MGLGFVNKRLRNDRLFGASYFVFRILFDFALMHEYVCGRPSMKTTTKMMVVYKSLLHVKFFYDWINQQSRLRKRMALAASVQPPRLDVKEASNSESSALRLSDTAQQDKKPMAVLKQRITVKESERREQSGATCTNSMVTMLSVQETTTGSRLRMVGMPA